MSDAHNAGELDRREFLTAGLGAAVLGAGALKAPEREFGKTGRRLPVFAFGGCAMVEKWAHAYGALLPFDQRVAMVRHAYEAGIRYFDTSPNYGESESIIGRALEDVRANIYLATKVGVPASDRGLLMPKQVRASVENSLERLRTDYLDCVQIHGPVIEYAGHDLAMGLYEELAKLREEKLFRFIGLTAHNVFERTYKLIDTGLFDQALIAYGYFPKGMNTILSHANLEWRQMCLSRARELGMGVLAMKVMGSFVFGVRAGDLAPEFDEAKLRKLRQAALRWVLRDDRVPLLVVGVAKPGDIDSNIETLNRDCAFTPGDQKVLAEFSALAFRSKLIKGMKTT
jgi:aryl-alcohol dehydrogenase-like predicted oxidoreductase